MNKETPSKSQTGGSPKSEEVKSHETHSEVGLSGNSFQKAGGSQKIVSPFVKRLRACLDTPTKGHVMQWTNDGNRFGLRNLPDLVDKVLPDMFKMHNLDAFYKKV